MFGRFVCLLLSSVILTGCASKMRIQSQSIEDEQAVALDYYILRKKSEPKAQLFFIPDFGTDSSDLAQSALFKALVDQGVEVVAMMRPGQNPSEKNAYDLRAYRLQRCAQLIREIRAERELPMMVAGSGEGAYVACSLGQELGTSELMLHNLGSVHFIAELQKIEESEPAKWSSIAQSNAVDTLALHQFVEDCQRGSTNTFTLVGKDAVHWNSYTNSSAISQLMACQPQWLWYSWEPDYLYLAEESPEAFLSQLALVLPLNEIEMIQLQLEADPFLAKELPEEKKEQILAFLKAL